MWGGGRLFRKGASGRAGCYLGLPVFYPHYFILKNCIVFTLLHFIDILAKHGYLACNLYLSDC